MSLEDNLLDEALAPGVPTHMPAVPSQPVPAVCKGEELGRVDVSRTVLLLLLLSYPSSLFLFEVCVLCLTP